MTSGVSKRYVISVGFHKKEPPYGGSFLFNFPTHIVIDEVFYTADLKMIKSCGSVISREGFVFRGHIRHGAEKHSKCGPIIPCISIMIATTIDVIIAVNASSVKLIDKLGCRIAADHYTAPL